MNQALPNPLVGVTSCLKPRDGLHFHTVGEKYVDAVAAGAAAIPVLIPAIGERLDPGLLLDRLDGLLVTGSPSNVDPARYGGPPAREGNEADPARDATTLPLILEALRRGVPLLCICRGLQELNVALGGSLHQHVQELPGRFDHRSDKTKTLPDRYGLAHPVRLTPGGRLQAVLEGPERIEVNSLHGQGIDRLADRLAVEAVAEDGTIEAVSVRDAQGFALAVQWHPEWQVLENPWSRRLFAAFGAAARQRAVRMGMGTAAAAA
ncbi:MAG TPA: gamma-glutamyl-gamma-aminobutyrate hydrolase family protein [Geminicoccaceae bacterium]|nr:gamma-glutamyl-gamma-aminobutyrate hydrolase family protein [Geminicoccaceae bacterium]